MAITIVFDKESFSNKERVDGPPTHNKWNLSLLDILDWDENHVLLCLEIGVRPGEFSSSNIEKRIYILFFDEDYSTLLSPNKVRVNCSDRDRTCAIEAEEGTLQNVGVSIRNGKNGDQRDLFIAKDGGTITLVLTEDREIEAEYTSAPSSKSVN